MRLAILPTAFSVRKSGEPSRTRTCDPLVKSQLLYQLSYRPTKEVSLKFRVSSFKFTLNLVLSTLNLCLVFWVFKAPSSKHQARFIPETTSQVLIRAR